MAGAVIEVAPTLLIVGVVSKSRKRKMKRMKMQRKAISNPRLTAVAKVNPNHDTKPH
jgi:hypothetical protein